MTRCANALTLTLLLTMSGCLMGNWPYERLVVNRQSVSDVTLDGDSLYFGGGYHLYKLNLTTRNLETIFSTDRLRIDQPIVSDGVVYFGGQRFANDKGEYAKASNFFALNLQNHKILWNFSLGVGGFGTFGTYALLAGDNLLVCAREHLHCLNRQSGKESWHVDNWMGRVSNGINRPYIYNNSVFYMIAEDRVADSQQTSENDGHWAEVALDSGNRSMFRVAERPGTWLDSSGAGNGALVDGVVYGATRIDRFGALDLKTRRMLWEIQGNNLLRPAVDDQHVFTSRLDSIQSLNRETGNVVWSVPLGDIAKLDLDGEKQKSEWHYESYWSRRFVLSAHVLVVQGSQGIAALQARDGKLLWLTKSVDDGTSEPIVWQNMVIASSQKSCSFFSLDLKTGREIWKVAVPDCNRYHVET